MRYCPSCQSIYTDETLRFCLQDGAQLVSSNTGNYPTQILPEMETVVRSDVLTSASQERKTEKAAVFQGENRSKPLLIIVMTAIGMCLIFGGIAAVWLLVSSDRSKSDSGLIPNSKTPIVMPTISGNTNINSRNLWEPIDFNASLNGDRLTFYRGTTVERCQADCDENAKCRGFALIREGFYNPDDPPMCYLLTKVTDSVPSACCISGIKK